MKDRRSFTCRSSVRRFAGDGRQAVPEAARGIGARRDDRGVDRRSPRRRGARPRGACTSRMSSGRTATTSTRGSYEGREEASENLSRIDQRNAVVPEAGDPDADARHWRERRRDAKRTSADRNGGERRAIGLTEHRYGAAAVIRYPEIASGEDDAARSVAVG